MGRPFCFNRCFAFGVSADELWAALERTDDYTGWWSWLTRFDADGLKPDSIARCVIQAPLPYRLDLEIAIDRVEPAALMEVTVNGDLRGPARLQIRESAGGCEAELDWELELQGALGVLAMVTRPAMAWAHDRVVERGVREFERHALAAEQLA